MGVFGIAIRIVSAQLYHKQIDYFGKRKSKVMRLETER